MSSDDSISCSVCGVNFHPRALSRHLANIHGVFPEPKSRGRPRTRTPEEISNRNMFENRSMSSSRTSSCSQSSQRLEDVFQKNSHRAFSRDKRATTDYMFGDIHPAVASAIAVASHGILEQHDSYDMRSLSQYVNITHGQVPEHIVPYIVLSATSAAWYVAHKFYIRERYMNSSQQHHQAMAEGIANSMLGWFTGLRPKKLVRSQSSSSTYSVNNKMDVHVTTEKLSQPASKLNTEPVTYVTNSGSCSKNQIGNAPEVWLSDVDEPSKSSVVIEQADLVPQSSVVIDAGPVNLTLPVTGCSNGQIDNATVLISKLSNGSSVIPVYVEHNLSTTSHGLTRREVEIDNVLLPVVRAWDESTSETSSTKTANFSESRDNMIPTLRDFLSTLTNDEFVDECIQTMTSESLQMSGINAVIENGILNKQSSISLSDQRMMNLDDYEIDVSAQGVNTYSPSRPQMNFEQKRTCLPSYSGIVDSSDSMNIINQQTLYEQINAFQLSVTYSQSDSSREGEVCCETTVSKTKQNNNESIPETAQSSTLLVDMPIVVSKKSVVSETKKSSSKPATIVNTNRISVDSKKNKKESNCFEDKESKATKKNEPVRSVTKNNLNNSKVEPSVRDNPKESPNIVCSSSAKISTRKPTVRKLMVSLTKDGVKSSTVEKKHPSQDVRSQKCAEGTGVQDTFISDDEICIVKVEKSAQLPSIHESVSRKKKNSKGGESKTKIIDVKLNEKTTVSLVDIVNKTVKKARKVEIMSDVEPDTDNETVTIKTTNNGTNTNTSETAKDEVVSAIKTKITDLDVNHDRLNGNLESFKIPRKSATTLREIPPNVLIELSKQEVEEDAFKSTNSESLLSVMSSESKVPSSEKDKNETSEKEVESGYKSRSSYDNRNIDILRRYRPTYSDRGKTYRSQDSYHHRSRSPQSITYRSSSENRGYSYHNYQYQNYYRRDGNAQPVRGRDRAFHPDYLEHRNGSSSRDGNMVYMTEEERREFHRFMDYRRN